MTREEFLKGMPFSHVRCPLDIYEFEPSESNVGFVGAIYRRFFHEPKSKRAFHCLVVKASVEGYTAQSQDMGEAYTVFVPFSLITQAIPQNVEEQKSASPLLCKHFRGWLSPSVLDSAEGVFVWTQSALKAKEEGNVLLVFEVHRGKDEHGLKDLDIIRAVETFLQEGVENNG